MKKVIFAILIAVLFSCSSVHQIGSVNMISARNVDSKTDYVLIKTGTNDSKANFRKTKAESVDQAINNAVQDIPGGEFLKNVKIYTDGKYFAVLGDVWGVSESANIEGFRVGDKVLIKNPVTYRDKFSKGEIIGLKDRKTCIIRLENGRESEFNYADLSKSGN